MNKSFRFTKQKRIIYEDVISRFDHPTADQVYASIHKNNPSISKSTVYRNLDVLSKEGLIKRLHLSGSDHFDSTLSKHYHVICKICHKVEDINIPYQELCDKKAQKDTGFIIEKHMLIFEGVCSECQLKTNKKGEKK